jgi:uncharacterized protein with von Willebrand factor type A (vWA) domain
MFNVLNHWSFDGVENFRLILSQLLCKSRQQQWEFSQLFDEFWQEILTSFDSKIKTAPSGASKRKRPKPVSLPEFKDWLYNKQSSVEEEIAFYNPGASSEGYNLANYHSDNITELVRIIELLAKNWATRPGRRKIRAKSGGQMDLRQAIRKNLSYGEIIDLSFRKPKVQKPRLVLVCDVSKSMEVFSSFTVQLLYAFQTVYRSIETFVFGTELHHITRLLKHHSFEESLELLSDQVPDWSGGTRIGHCLDTLIYKYGTRLLHGRVIFLMISDGWDTGEIDLLEDSLKHIKRRVKKLIWLNPHARGPAFKPEVKGMMAALPYIDYLHGVHQILDLKTKI